MRDSCARFDPLLDHEDASLLVRENEVFHGLVQANCGNPLVAPLARHLVELPLVYPTYSAYTPDRHRLSHHQHEMNLDALDRSDEEAAQRTMEQRVKDAGEAVLPLICSGATPVAGF